VPLDDLLCRTLSQVYWYVIGFRLLAVTLSAGEWSPVYLQKSTLQQKYISNSYSGESPRFLWASRGVTLPRTISPLPTISYDALQYSLGCTVGS